MTKIGGGVPGVKTPVVQELAKLNTTAKAGVAKETSATVAAGAGSKSANVQTAKTEEKTAAKGQEALIPRGKTPTDTGKAEDRYANAAKQLSAIATALSDLMAKIAVDQDGNDRKTALDSRTAARDSAKADATEKANKTRDDVEKAKIQATVQLVLTIITAAIQIASSGVQLYGAVKGVQQAKLGGAGQLTDLLGDATKNAGPKPA